MPQPADRDDSGKVDTVLFQSLVRLAPLLGKPRGGPDLALGIFGMYNHINSATLSQDRLKFGADLNVIPTSFMALALRFDRVMPDGPNSSEAFSAISPRLIFHTNWLSREYVIVNRYTRATSTAPSLRLLTTREHARSRRRSQRQRPGVHAGAKMFSAPPDPNLVVVSSVISF